MEALTTQNNELCTMLIKPMRMFIYLFCFTHEGYDGSADDPEQ